MTSIKVKFRPSTIPGHLGSIYYQVSHERKVRQINSGLLVFPDEWDARRSTVATSHDSTRMSAILSIRKQIHIGLERFGKIVRRLENSGLAYSADDITNEYTIYARKYTLCNFTEAIIAKLRQTGKIRTSETYAAALNSFKKFLSYKTKEETSQTKVDIMLDCLSAEIMEEYETWLQHRGIRPNSTSFYARILRAVYNRAVEQDIIENRHPFRHVYTGICKTVKRALPLDTIRKIKAMDLSATPTLDFARDIFMMSFYLRGMSFIDMAFLRKNDLKNGAVTYRRHKTGQQLIIGWTKEMQHIIDKYPTNNSAYLLPIIRETAANERNAYRNANYNINRNLKKIARMAGAPLPLTLYVARHSWASVAKAIGIPLSIISEGMGHDSETTTKIYLSSIGTSAIDNANEKILSSL